MTDHYTRILPDLRWEVSNAYNSSNLGREEDVTST